MLDSGKNSFVNCWQFNYIWLLFFSKWTFSRLCHKLERANKWPHIPIWCKTHNNFKQRKWTEKNNFLATHKKICLYQSWWWKSDLPLMLVWFRATISFLTIKNARMLKVVFSRLCLYFVYTISIGCSVTNEVFSKLFIATIFFV